MEQAISRYLNFFNFEQTGFQKLRYLLRLGATPTEIQLQTDYNWNI